MVLGMVIYVLLLVDSIENILINVMVCTVPGRIFRTQDTIPII